MCSNSPKMNTSGDANMVQGHLAVIDDKPMHAQDRELSIFHIFAARATAELIRRQTERKLEDCHQREHELRLERRRMEAGVTYLREEIRSRSEFRRMGHDLISRERIASSEARIILTSQDRNCPCAMVAIRRSGTSTHRSRPRSIGSTRYGSAMY